VVPRCKGGEIEATRAAAEEHITSPAGRTVGGPALAGTSACGSVLTVYIRIKLQLDLQADKSSVVVKGPFFPQV
jgi:hypothetical protein